MAGNALTDGGFKQQWVVDDLCLHLLESSLRHGNSGMELVLLGIMLREILREIQSTYLRVFSHATQQPASRASTSSNVGG